MQCECSRFNGVLTFWVKNFSSAAGFHQRCRRQNEYRSATSAFNPQSSWGFESCVWSAGRNDAPLADTLPDPAGGHPLSPAVLFRLGHRVRGPPSVVFWHQLAVVRYKVAPQLVIVLNRQRQEELDSTEDIQQRLRSADKNSHTSASAGRGRRHRPLTWSFFGSALFPSFIFPLLWTFSLFFTCIQTQHTRHYHIT